MRLHHCLFGFFLREYRGADADSVLQPGVKHMAAQRPLKLKQQLARIVWSPGFVGILGCVVPGASTPPAGHAAELCNMDFPVDEAAAAASAAPHHAMNSDVSDASDMKHVASCSKASPCFHL